MTPQWEKYDQHWIACIEVGDSSSFHDPESWGSTEVDAIKTDMAVKLSLYKTRA